VFSFAKALLPIKELLLCTTPPLINVFSFAKALLPLLVQYYQYLHYHHLSLIYYYCTHIESAKHARDMIGRESIEGAEAWKYKPPRFNKTRIQKNYIY
jgi:hypothetical protein